MYIKIEAKLKSPLMIGSKTLNNNYRESRPYIPGSVLRAAFARAIIERCSYSHKNSWLTYKNQEECKGCKFQEICNKFSEIKFPALYPLGGYPYPMTARKLKYGDEEEQKIQDILKSRISGSKKIEEEQWERLEGIYKNGFRVNILHTLITRTAVDYSRKSAKQGALYSQNAVSELLYYKGKKTETVFSGVINEDEGLFRGFEKIRNLHIGADITRGMGLCEMTFAQATEPDTIDKLDGRIAAFNEGIEEEELFISVDLLADAYLSLEDIGKDYESPALVSDEAFKNYLKQQLDLPAAYELIKTYKAQEIMRGFNTAKQTEKDMRRSGRVVVKAGAVFVYKIPKAEYDVSALFEIQKRGIGENTEHGFGQVTICDEFHIKFDALQGGY